MLIRIGGWRRWGANAAILEKAFSRPDFGDALAQRLVTAREGRGGSMLRQALRWASLDPHLPELARRANLPSVRGVALQALLDRAATWPTGWSSEWVDKVYGLKKRVPMTESRELAEAPEPLALIEASLSDRSATVRRIASQALVARRFDEDEVGRVAALFAVDRNRMVRESAEFVLKERAKAGSLALRPSPDA